MPLPGPALLAPVVSEFPISSISLQAPNTVILAWQHSFVHGDLIEKYNVMLLYLVTWLNRTKSLAVLSSHLYTMKDVWWYYDLSLKIKKQIVVKDDN